MATIAPERPRMRISDIRRDMTSLADPARAAHLQRYFKTGPGQYGEGDRFIGLRVPQVRRLAARWRDIPMTTLTALLCSAVHEERQLALLVMVDRFNRAAPRERQRLYRCYMAHTRYINNWDLVDVSAPPIVGGWLWTHDRSVLAAMAASERLWERRIAIMATFYFVRRDDYADTLFLADRLLADPHDLIHKAVGWMLREIGKRRMDIEAEFLKSRYHLMPRTMLRYAIEKFPESLRNAYLKGRM